MTVTFAILMTIAMLMMTMGDNNDILQSIRPISFNSQKALRKLIKQGGNLEATTTMIL